MAIPTGLNDFADIEDRIRDHTPRLPISEAILASLRKAHILVPMIFVAVEAYKDNEAFDPGEQSPAIARPMSINSLDIAIKYSLLLSMAGK